MVELALPLFPVRSVLKLDPPTRVLDQMQRGALDESWSDPERRAMTTLTCSECEAPATIQNGTLTRTCTHSAPVRGHLTAPLQIPGGKRLIAESMFHEGRAFLRGWHYLAKDPLGGEPSQYVALHLLGQGTELVLKGLLLLADYDKYKPKLRQLGHDLPASLASVRLEYPALDKWDPVATEQFEELSELYKAQTLRYADLSHLFHAPSLILVDEFLKGLASVLAFGPLGPTPPAADPA